MLICAATGNAGKLKELRRILEAQGHQVKSQKELGITCEPEETGTTFAENARIKAQTISALAGLPTVADDSGLEVDALGGAPGVYSARYCGRHGDDEANNDKLLAELADVPEGQRAARFVSAVCLWMPDGRDLVVTGEGRIDWQSAFGKVPSGIGMRCKRKGIPAVAIVGGMGDGAEKIYDFGVESILPTINGAMDIKEALDRAVELYSGAADRMFRMLKVGMSLK